MKLQRLVSPEEIDLTSYGNANRAESRRAFSRGPKTNGSWTREGVTVRKSKPMTKQMISFTDPQRAFLKREAKRLGISIAELVRRIIDRHIEATKQ